MPRHEAATLGDVGVIKADRLVVEIPDQTAGLDALAAKLAQGDRRPAR